MKIILPSMCFTSGFSSSSKLSNKLSADRCAIADYNLATACLTLSLTNTTEAKSYLYHYDNYNYKHLQPYIFQTFSNYITQNHILKQS
ncbi:hypothetical protein [Winogradskyella sediminis]|nr:hypothetical protein [Winogradskyella sediminis]REG87988.1 hypothetical protein C8N41_102843 [Winogradskyella sediminis]